MTGALKMCKLDYMSMKVYLKSYLVFMAYPILFAWWGPSGMAIMGGLMIGMVAGSVFSVQEKNKLERLYGVLAISDSSLVAGRFLFMTANCLLVPLVLLPLHAVARYVTGYGFDSSEFLLALGVSYLLYWLLNAYQIPLYFKFGYTKMRMWVMAPFLIIALVPMIFSNLLKEQITSLIPAAEEFLKALFQNAPAATLLCVAAGTLLAGISYLASIRTYKSTRR